MRRRTLMKPNSPSSGPRSGADDFPVFAHDGDIRSGGGDRGETVIGIVDSYIAPDIQADEIRRPDGSLETIEGYALVVQIDRILEDFGLQVPIQATTEDVQTVPADEVLPGLAPARTRSARASEFPQPRAWSAALLGTGRPCRLR